MSDVTKAPDKQRKFVVVKADELPDGETLVTTVGGTRIVVINRGGEFHALLHRCPHLGGPLGDGDVVGLVEADLPGNICLDDSRAFIVCPWHGWEFDITTGQSYWNPARSRVRAYSVDVEPGSTLTNEIQAGRAGVAFEGPYTVATFPLSLEDGYIVVTMDRPPTSGRPDADRVAKQPNV